MPKTASHRATSGGGWRLAMALVAAAWLGCSSPEPSVEVRASGGWKKLPSELTQARIQREGYGVIAHFVFEGEADSRLVVELHIRVDPEVEFQTGDWLAVQGTDFTGQGEVEARSLEFLGGQGGKPSVGGEFLLMGRGQVRYRVSVPPTAADVVEWRGS